MDLTTIETALTSWIEVQSGLPLRWKQQSPQALPWPHVEARLLAILGKGRDEQVWSYDRNTDANALTMTGVRSMTVQLNFLSLSQSLGDSARFYAERFRTRLDRPSSHYALVAANLSLVNASVLGDSDFTDRSQRVVSQVSMDLVFELRSSEVDDTWDGSYINRAVLRSERYVRDEDGNPIVDDDGNYVTTEASDAFTVSGGG